MNKEERQAYEEYLEFIDPGTIGSKRIKEKDKYYKDIPDAKEYGEGIEIDREFNEIKRYSYQARPIVSLWWGWING